MKVITQNDIKEINRLYATLKTYAAVSRATGFAPSTIKKYVQPDYQIIDDSQIKRFNQPLPDFAPELFRTTDWADLCVLSAEEIEEVVELWKEIEI